METSEIKEIQPGQATAPAKHPITDGMAGAIHRDATAVIDGKAKREAITNARRELTETYQPSSDE